MSLQADLFFSFRSPYSYLAIGRYRQLTENYTVDIALRPVTPLALRQPDFFENNHPNWLRYTIIDVARVAQYLGLPLAPPNPDPIVQDLATRKIAAEQPYIHRITRMGQAASNAGRGIQFADEAAKLIWSGTKDWHHDELLAGAATRAGLEFSLMASAADQEYRELDAQIAANEAALEAAGHWGVPTLAFRGEPFFGQDRIDLAIMRMEQAGLEPR